MFSALFFFSLGYIFKKHMGILLHCNLFTLIGLFFIFLPIYVFSININGNISLVSNSLGGNLLGYVASTVSGILLIVCFFCFCSRTMNDYLNIGGILRNISRNALIVLGVHFWIIVLCKFFLKDLQGYDFYPFLVTLITFGGVSISIPLFRNKLYWLLGKTKISIRESLSIE